MILTPSTKEEGSRFRATLRVDRTVFHLAGLHTSQVAAMAQARDLVAKFEKDIRHKLKSQSLFKLSTHAGLNPKVSP